MAMTVTTFTQFVCNNNIGSLLLFYGFTMHCSLVPRPYSQYFALKRLHMLFGLQHYIAGYESSSITVNLEIFVVKIFS